MSELPPTYESITVTGKGLSMPAVVFERLSPQELKLITRIRSIRQKGVLRVRLEASQPVKVKFIIDAKVESL